MVARGLRRRHAAALLLGALSLAAPLASAAPWLQAGYDAARTSATPDAGPETDDVGFVVQLPGSRAGKTTPLVFDGAVWVLTTDYSMAREPPDSVVFSGRQDLRAQGIHRVDLATGEVREVVAFDVLADAFASDGTRFFVTRDRGVDAYALDGTVLWSWEHPSFVANHVATACAPPAVAGTLLVLACEERYADPQATYHQNVGGFFGFTPLIRTRGEVFAAALDVTDGQAVWVVPARDLAAWSPPFSAYAYATARPDTADAVSVVGAHAFVVFQSASGDVAGTFALRLEDGAFALFDAETVEDSYFNLGGTPERPRAGYIARSPVTGGGATAHARLLGLRHYDLAEERSTAGTSYPPPEGAAVVAADPATGIAANNASLYVSAWRSVHKYDRVTRTEVWVSELDAALFLGRAFVLTPDRLYTLVGPVGGTDIAAVSVLDGSTVWRRPFGSMSDRPAGSNAFGPAWHFAIGEGVLVLAGLDGRVIVLGRPPAAIVPEIRVSDAYPAPGDPVSVDLSASRAGAFGPPIAFRADWGDGEATDWTDRPVLEHAYAEAGERRARFHVRNTQNQTASETFVFHVGAEEPTLLATAFSADNQERTFFGLGIAATAIGGFLGLGRYERRRRRVHRELAAIEAAYARTRGNPSECEAALAERKAHVRGLHFDGNLEESQLVVLERRIEEIGKGLRLGTLDERFGFLPHGMVQTLQEMLADGHITAWERRHFLEALERDTHLTPEQRERVRALIESWFARDNKPGAEA